MSTDGTQSSTVPSDSDAPSSSRRVTVYKGSATIPDPQDTNASIECLQNLVDAGGDDHSDDAITLSVCEKVQSAMREGRDITSITQDDLQSVGFTNEDTRLRALDAITSLSELMPLLDEHIEDKDVMTVLKYLPDFIDDFTQLRVSDSFACPFDGLS